METTTSWAITDDVSRSVVALTALVVVAALLSLIAELRKGGRVAAVTFLSGAAAVLLLACAVLRPVSVVGKSSEVGARVIVLVDASRRLSLPGVSGTRRDVATAALDALGQHMESARIRLLTFDDAAPRELPPNSPIPVGSDGSDLVGAFEHLAGDPGERPDAVVVVSDGRLSRPAEGASEASLKDLVGRLGVPVHTVAVGESAPQDAAIRSVRAAGAAVAHQPLALAIEVACTGALECERVPVTVRELRDGVEPATLASGNATVQDGTGRIELEVTLDRAGTRVVEVAISAPDGDAIPENDTRYVTFVVARDRVRLLHLAGRPTYDVRALRMWLKSDEAVDVVAFFILRGETDDPGAPPRELALIKFPVDELFVEHLSSFDAVILQDIDAERYRLDQYLPRLTEYVLGGGGLIMVGGPSSFAGGRYAGTALDQVLPVEQPRPQRALGDPHRAGDPGDEPPSDVFVPTPFVPRYTQAGRVAAITRPLRDLLGEELPTMPGTNRLGAVRPGGFVLWEHPDANAVGGDAMPVLALREAGDGRTIALGVDATHQLAFGPLAATVDGRAYGALWDGLLGWLMRDPRYEAARVELVSSCIAGEPATLRVTRLPTMTGGVVVRLEALKKGGESKSVTSGASADQLAVDVPLPALEAGGYTAKVSIGASPPSRYDFSCGTGGTAFSDTRPDPALLGAIARATGGKAVTASAVPDLPKPGVALVSAQRHVSPLLPAWAWALLASVALGVHWFARRTGGWS